MNAKREGQFHPPVAPEKHSKYYKKCLEDSERSPKEGSKDEREALSAFVNSL
jgi:hypothetical protein